MPKYNLDTLGSEEFERLCQTLVQQIIGPGAKVYGIGKDGAREATFEGKAPYPSTVEPWEGKWIFQAKFHDISQIGHREARRAIMADLDDELDKITEKYRHRCDNFILMTNVSLTPAFQTGTKDLIDQKIVPKYKKHIKNIHVWGADEICRFLDAKPDVRKTYSTLLVTGDIIASLLGLISGDSNRQNTLIKLYCQGCFEHEKHAVLDDAGDVEDKPIPLVKVFVDLDVVVPDLSQEHSKAEGCPAWIERAGDDKERKSAMSYLLDDSLEGIVLIGTPGQGKSTLGQFLAQVHRSYLLGRERELGEYAAELEKCAPRIPIRITLKDYAQWVAEQRQKQQPDGLSSYIAGLIARDADRETDATAVQNILERNSSLLILDGLDEVSDKKLRARMLENITVFVDQVRDVIGGNIRVIATTRPYGYSDEFSPTHYLHLTLDRLSPHNAITYANRWTKERQLNETEGERVLAGFQVCLIDKTVNVLTGTPLQVTILLIIIRARGTPPKQREELLDRYMDIIYQREQKKEVELLQTSQNLIYGLHKYLAYLLHRRAERDETGARMPSSEFEDAVRAYLFSCDPTLSKEELEGTTRQIIKEASERLVLIVGLREGVVGFELTSVREFFAAAHLVDTARDSRERDARFKAICRSSHWRNVALFFAGRVGRMLPGEAPSLIDVCRQIDTERVDRLLKRGAALALQITDERAMREVHNEIGAIQYALTRLESGLDDADEFAKVLTGFPERFLERVVVPELENRLKTLPVESGRLYGDLYQKVRGRSPCLEECIKNAAADKNPKIRLWALRQAVLNRISEPWIADLLESVAGEDLRTVARALSSEVENFTVFLDFALSAAAREILEHAIILWSGMHSGDLLGFSRVPESLKLQIAAIAETRYPNILCRTVEALDTIFKILHNDDSTEWWSLTQGPSFLNPEFRKIVSTLRPLFDDASPAMLIERTSTERLISALISLCEDQSGRGFQRDTFRTFGEDAGSNWYLQQLLWTIGIWNPAVSRAMREGQVVRENLAKLARYYDTGERFSADAKRVVALLRQESEKVTNHPQKILLWLSSDCNDIVEKLLDSEILGKISDWLNERAVTQQVLRFFSSTLFTRMSDYDLGEIVLDLAIWQIDDSARAAAMAFPIYQFLDLSVLATEQRLRNKVQVFANKILEAKNLSSETMMESLTLVFWFGTLGDLLENPTLFEIMRRMRKEHILPRSWWLGPDREDVLKRSKVLDLVKNAELEISAVGAVSLQSFNTRITDEEIGEKLYDLSKDSSDPWQPLYLKAMSFCSLRWNKWRGPWMESLEHTSSTSIVEAWAAVITNGGCAGLEGREAFLDVLLNILENPKKFPGEIQTAAKVRLARLVVEIEPIGFDEAPLNLPFPQILRLAN